MDSRIKIHKREHKTRRAVSAYESLWAKPQMSYETTKHYTLSLLLERNYSVSDAVPYEAAEEAERIARKAIIAHLYGDLYPLVDEIAEAVYASDGRKALGLLNSLRNRITNPELFKDAGE